MPTRPIEEVLADHAAEIMAIPGVALVYEGRLSNGSPCIKVGVVETTRALEKAIPSLLEGYPVVVDETGPIRPR